eukprot:12890446-Prorocentrum_lima.AAC.1
MSPHAAHDHEVHVVLTHHGVPPYAYRLGTSVAPPKSGLNGTLLTAPIYSPISLTGKVSTPFSR